MKKMVDLTSNEREVLGAVIFYDYIVPMLAPEGATVEVSVKITQILFTKHIEFLSVWQIDALYNAINDINALRETWDYNRWFDYRHEL
jgi:hypothetical protein